MGQFLSSFAINVGMFNITKHFIRNIQICHYSSHPQKSYADKLRYNVYIYMYSDLSQEYHICMKVLPFINQITRYAFSLIYLMKEVRIYKYNIVKRKGNYNNCIVFLRYSLIYYYDFLLLFKSFSFACTNRNSFYLH